MDITYSISLEDWAKVHNRTYDAARMYITRTGIRSFVVKGGKEVFIEISQETATKYMDDPIKTKSEPSPRRKQRELDGPPPGFVPPVFRINGKET
jgi:hypothetical protein